MTLDQEAQQLIAQDFELEPRAGEPFIETLAYKIAYLLEHNPDLLFSYFYRMDIDEKKIEHILLNQGPVAINIQLADLILNRQLKRAETKRIYKSDHEIEI